MNGTPCPYPLPDGANDDSFTPGAFFFRRKNKKTQSARATEQPVKKDAAASTKKAYEPSVVSSEKTLVGTEKTSSLSSATTK